MKGQSTTFSLSEDIFLSTGCQSLAMTAAHDLRNPAIIFLANKSAGLTIYSLENPIPLLVSQVSIESFAGLDVMNLTQSGDLLFLALGSFFLDGQNSGLAVVDVSDPSQPKVFDVWVFDQPGEGAGDVAVSQDRAYLAAMGHGIFIFDISEPQNIRSIRHFIPDPNFPQSDPDLSKINARGIHVIDQQVYLAYDAGGLRIIDFSDEENPREIGKYSNPLFLNRPRAYNNLEIRNDLAYVTVDYCGLEIIDIKSPEEASQIGWWNPWDCPENNWFTSVGHTNELAFDKSGTVIFISTGKSELFLVDVSEASAPNTIGFVGELDNQEGTWGVSSSENQVFLTYICTLGIPFSSRVSGMRVLSFDITTPTTDLSKGGISVIPNPTSSHLTWNMPGEKSYNCSIYSIDGQYYGDFSPKDRPIDVSQLNEGIYILQVRTGNKIFIEKFIKINQD